MPDDPDEQRLLDRARHGDFEAFQQIATQLQPRIYRLAMRLLKHQQDAEDVTQKTLLALIEKIDTFRERSSLSSWVLSIAWNSSLQVLRARRTRPEVPMQTFDDGETPLPHPEFIAPWTKTPLELLQQKELDEALQIELDSLASSYRDVFMLRDIEGMSIQETAQLLQISEANVKVRLVRARLMLREKLTVRFGDPLQRKTPDPRHKKTL